MKKSHAGSSSKRGRRRRARPVYLTVTIRVPAPLLARVEDALDDDGRTMSEVTRGLWLEFVRRNGK